MIGNLPGSQGTNTDENGTREDLIGGQVMEAGSRHPAQARSS